MMQGLQLGHRRGEFVADPAWPDRRGPPGFVPVMPGEAGQLLAKAMLTHTMATGLAFWRTSEIHKPAALSCRLPPFTATYWGWGVPFIQWA